MRSHFVVFRLIPNRFFGGLSCPGEVDIYDRQVCLRAFETVSEAKADVGWWGEFYNRKRQSYWLSRRGSVGTDLPRIWPSGQTSIILCRPFEARSWGGNKSVPRGGLWRRRMRRGAPTRQLCWPASGKVVLPSGAVQDPGKSPAGWSYQGEQFRPIMHQHSNRTARSGEVTIRGSNPRSRHSVKNDSAKDL